MAATLAKALRGGRSGVSSGLLPAIVGRVPQEGMLSQAYPAVGMGRLMHAGQWRNPVLSQGAGSIKTPRKMEQFCSKRFLHPDRQGRHEGPPDHPAFAMFAAASCVASLISGIYVLPVLYSQLKLLLWDRPRRVSDDE